MPYKISFNPLFDEDKLNTEIKDFKTYEEAEEYARSYPLSLNKKIEFLATNVTILKLKKKSKNSSSSKRITKVFF